MTQREKDLHVLRENISLLDRRLGRESQKRLPLFSELAAVTLQPAGEEQAPLLTRIRETAQAYLCADTEQEPDAVRAVRQTLQALDRATYIRTCLAEAKDSAEQLSLSDLLPLTHYRAARIAYVRNPYTDEAYEDFAATLPTPTVRYADSFREACDMVTTAEAEFCILPYRNSSGLLSSFVELAERYSLYICALCRVFHAEGTDVTHFALYGRQLPFPGGEDDTFLRFSLLCESMTALSQHLQAAAVFGVRLEALQAVPYPANEGATLCTATAVLQHDQLLPWLTYLTLFTDGYTCHGLYKEI